MILHFFPANFIGMNFIQICDRYVNQQISPSGGNDKPGVSVNSMVKENKSPGFTTAISHFSLVDNDKVRLTGIKLIWIGFLTILQFSAFSQNAKRIISLAPSITENLYLLEAQDMLVGCTSYCTLAIVDGVEQIGSTVDVNVEKIFSLKPDLVLTMLMTKTQDVEAMKKLGLNVVVIPTPKTFEEICAQTVMIADLIGRQQIAEKVIQETKEKVNAIKQNSEKKPGGQKIFFQLGANPVFSVLQNTFMDDFIVLNNGVNIANGLRSGIISREAVLVKNPDVIIIATMGGFGAEEKKIWSQYKGLKAAENDRIFLIDSETSCSPTPVNFAKALSEVHRFIYQ